MDYSEVGQRGHTATALLQEFGIEARNLNGGYRTWRAVDAASFGDVARILALHRSA